jgi:hypothetical protein
MSRCLKGRFTDDSAARLGLKRCHGGPVVNGIKWLPCRYLERCLGMSLKKWQKKHEKQ